MKKILFVGALLFMSSISYAGWFGQGQVSDLTHTATDVAGTTPTAIQGSNLIPNSNFTWVLYEDNDIAFDWTWEGNTTNVRAFIHVPAGKTWPSKEQSGGRRIFVRADEAVTIRFKCDVE